MARPIVATLRLALVALVFCSALSLHTAHAAALQRYVSAQYGYAFSYPASWKAAGATGMVDKRFQSPDGATTFAVLVSGGTLTASAAKSTALGAVRSLLHVAAGATLQTTVSTPAVAGGMASQVEARGVVNGSHRFAIARAVGYDGAIFIFYGYGPTPPSIAVDGPAVALQNIMASITLAPVRLHYTAATVQFSLFYPQGWRRVSYPDLGKIVEDGPAGAVIFADYGHGAANIIDLRFLLLQNVVLMGSIQGQPTFSTAAIDGKVAQVVQVGIKDKQGRALEAIVADLSFNGYNYVVGGAAPRGSAAEQAIVDAIDGASMRPPALPPDTGAFVRFTGPGHRYSMRRPAAWIADEAQKGIDASFTARDGDLTLVVQTRTGTVAGVLASLTGSMTAGSSGVKKVSTPAALGTLSGQEVVVTQTIIPKQSSNGIVTPALVQESHLLAAASGHTVYVVSWSFYTNAPDAQALQRLARRAVASFAVGA